MEKYNFMEAEKRNTYQVFHDSLIFISGGYITKTTTVICKRYSLKMHAHVFDHYNFYPGYIMIGLQYMRHVGYRVWGQLWFAKII